MADYPYFAGPEDPFQGPEDPIQGPVDPIERVGMPQSAPEPGSRDYDLMMARQIGYAEPGPTATSREEDLQRAMRGGYAEPGHLTPEGEARAARTWQNPGQAPGYDVDAFAGKTLDPGSGYAQRRFTPEQNLQRQSLQAQMQGADVETVGRLQKQLDQMVPQWEKKANPSYDPPKMPLVWHREGAADVGVPTPTAEWAARTRQAQFTYADQLRLQKLQGDKSETVAAVENGQLTLEEGLHVLRRIDAGIDPLAARKEMTDQATHQAQLQKTRQQLAETAAIDDLRQQSAAEIIARSVKTDPVTGARFTVDKNGGIHEFTPKQTHVPDEKQDLATAKAIVEGTGGKASGTEADTEAIRREYDKLRAVHELKPGESVNLQTMRKSSAPGGGGPSSAGPPDAAPDSMKVAEAQALAAEKARRMAEGERQRQTREQQAKDYLNRRVSKFE